MSEPPAPPTPEQLIYALAQQVASLTAALQNQAPPVVTTTIKSSLNKPDLFEGQNSVEARRFLAQFIAWSSEQSDLKNDTKKTIKVALGFMTKKVANWATAYLTEFNAGNVSFNGDWDEFIAAFNRVA